jgi:DNA-binding NtrC family response regulator
MVALCDRDTIDLRDLPPEIARVKQLEAPISEMSHLSAANLEMVGLPLEEVEREHIRRTLEATGQNRTEAAKLLKIGERTLYRKITRIHFVNGPERGAALHCAGRIINVSHRSRSTPARRVEASDHLR